MGCMLEVFNWVISWERSISNEEDENQEGPELECSTVTSALGVFTLPEAEVSQLEQVGDMTGFGVGGGGSCGQN